MVQNKEYGQISAKIMHATSVAKTCARGLARHTVPIPRTGCMPLSLVLFKALQWQQPLPAAEADALISLSAPDTITRQQLRIHLQFYP